MAHENEVSLSGIFSAGYGIIPKKLMQDQNLSVHEKCIIAYMLSFTGGGNSCFPSYKKIAQDLKISEPTIAKSLKNLKEFGFLAIEKLYPNEPLKQNSKYILTFLGEVPTLKDVKSGTKNGEVSHLTTLSSNNNIDNNNISNNIQSAVKKKREFIAPTLEEVEKYVSENNLNVDANYFLSYYGKLSWQDAYGNPIKNWKNKLRNCEEWPKFQKKKEGAIETTGDEAVDWAIARQRERDKARADGSVQ